MDNFAFYLSSVVLELKHTDGWMNE